MDRSRLDEIKIFTKYCETADEFLNYLKPSNGWHTSNPHRFVSDAMTLLPFTHWIFRGQVDACWRLTPSAMRENGIIERATERYYKAYMDMVDDLFEPDPPEDHERNVRNYAWVYVHAKFEEQVVKDFVDLTDRAGQVIPSHEERFVTNQERFSNTPPKLDIDQQRNFERIEYALAQHHGIPTRILDWTYDPFVASYFAIEDITSNKSGFLAVWALDTSNIDLDRSDMSILRPYTYKFGYLRSQKGLFSLDKNLSSEYQKSSHWRSLEEIIPEYRRTSSNSPIRRIVLPINQVVKLNIALSKWGYRKFTMKPSLSNIADSAQEVFNEKWFQPDFTDDDSRMF